MDLAKLAIAPAATAGPAGAFDARWKLAAVGCAIAGTLLLHSLVTASVAFAGSVLLACWARLPARWVAARLGTVLPLLAFFTLPLPLLLRDQGPAWHWGWAQVSVHGVNVALLLFTKALTVLFLVLFLLATARLDATLKAARALGVPSLLVHVVLLSHRYVFVLGEELARLRIAVRVRGFRNRANRHSYRTIGHMTGTLLVRGHERAEGVAQAMRCRGFDGQFRSLTQFHTAGRDVLLFLSITLPTIVLMILDSCYR